MLDSPICMWITDIDRVTDSISLTLFLSSPEPCCFVILDGLCVLSIKSAIDVVNLIALSVQNLKLRPVPSASAGFNFQMSR